MKAFNRISATALLAAASLTCSPPAWSLGLGDATVESFLNQPLQARIDLVSQASDDLTTVTARLASAKDYELIGASRDSVPVPISFTVENIDGDAYLTASSDLPIGDPVVRLIVEVNWSSGRMLREYTLFLDPPAVPSAAPIPRIDETRPSAAVAPAPAVSEPASTAVEAPAPAEQRPAPARTPSASEYGPVASGETLWAIARDWSRDSGLDINKVMLAIQHENPNAFLRNNINLLKRGAILRMPSVDDVSRISTAAAIDEVTSQEEAFTGARRTQSAASPSTPLLSEQSAAPEPEIYEPQTEVQEEPATAEPVEAIPAEPEVAEAESAEPDPVTAQDVEVEVEDEDELAATDDMAGDEEVTAQLELVPPSADSELDSTYGFEESDESGGAVAATATLRENLARTEEDLFNQKQQNEYLEQRIKELEAELAAGQQGTAEDSDLANMEQRLRQEREAAAAAAESQPWYIKFRYWLIGLLIVVAGLIGWGISRRTEAAAIAAAEDEAINDLKEEAEEVLRVLEESPEKAAAEDEVDEEETGAEEEPEAAADEDEAKPVQKFGEGDDNAEFLDEESSDPEIQLDLARAYISMGDKEAARVILEEVASTGSEEQQAEAKSMMDQL